MKITLKEVRREEYGSALTIEASVQSDYGPHLLFIDIVNENDYCIVEKLYKALRQTDREYDRIDWIDAIYYNSWEESHDCECCGWYYDKYFELRVGNKKFEAYEDGHFGNGEDFDIDDIIEAIRAYGMEVEMIWE